MHAHPTLSEVLDELFKQVGGLAYRQLAAILATPHLVHYTALHRHTLIKGMPLQLQQPSPPTPASSLWQPERLLH